jgi:cytoskeleton protein RodZ
MSEAREPAGAADPASDAGIVVGETLARARAAAGLTVEDVARQLKFGARQIQLLEQGRLEQLPGGAFVRGIVRNYARLLKLDPEPLLLRVSGSGLTPPVMEGAVPFRKPIPFSDSARRVNLGYALLSLAALGAVAAVVLGWPEHRGEGGLTFVAPGSVTAEAPAPQRAAEPENVPLAAVGTPLAVVAPDESAASRPAEAEPPQAPSPAPHRLTLRFTGASWVEVRDRDGRILTSQLNPPGSTRVIEGTPPFRLVIGNAQQVTLLYGDQPVDLAPHLRLDVARLTLQ